MNQSINQSNKPLVSEAEENVLFGVIGAFLFSLVGAVVYVVLNMVGYIAALSGLIGVVCAIKGYAIFAKRESKRGLIISVIMAAVVIVIAWYVCFCLDMVEAYQMWFENGEVDYAPTIFEYLPYGFWDLTVNPVYFVDLLLSLALGAVGCWSYVSNMLKRQKALAAQAAQTETDAPFTVWDAPAGEAYAAEDAVSDADSDEADEADEVDEAEADEADEA